MVAACPGVTEWVRLRMSLRADHTATRERATPLSNPAGSFPDLNLLWSKRLGAHLNLKAVNEGNNSWFMASCRSLKRCQPRLVQHARIPMWVGVSIRAHHDAMILIVPENLSLTVQPGKIAL